MTEEMYPAQVQIAGKQEGEAKTQGYHAEARIWSEKMLAALERGNEGNKWYSLMDKIYRANTLEIAWEKVRVNAGACGVDGITITRFAKDSPKRLLAVEEQLKDRSYHPQAVKRKWIPKAGSKSAKRPLGIPTVRDRVVQTATKLVIEPIFEREFAEHSYGFRPGRSCKDALRRVDGLLKEGYVYIVDADIQSFFDRIDQQRLMNRIKERIADGGVLSLIEKMLKARLLEEGKQWVAEEGTPQGGVISPLLANIYLNELDWMLAKAGYEMTRYADDFVVQCRSAAQAAQALALIKRWMETNGLELHPEKTRIVELNVAGEFFDFLGYRFLRSRRKDRVVKVPRDKSMKQLRARLKPLTRRNNGHSLEAIIRRITPIQRGWYEYYRHSPRWLLRQVDGWIRGRLRSLLRRRRHGRGRGRGEDHQRWDNYYFARHGFFSLEAAHEFDVTSLRCRAKC